MSLVFAGALLAIQSVEFWVESWQPRIGQPAPISIRLPAFSVVRLHLDQPAEMVHERVIVSAGAPLITDEDSRLVEAYERMRRQHQLGWCLGMFLVSLVAGGLLLAELGRAPGNNQLMRAQVTLLSLLLLFTAGAKAFLLLTGLPAYYFPMAGVVLLAAFLFDRRIALAVNLFASVIFASLLGFDVAAFVVVFVTAYTGTLFMRDRKRRRSVVIAGSLSGWLAAVALLVLMLVFDGRINITREVLLPEHSEVLAALVGGVFSGLVAFLLIEPVGWLVGKVSRSKLLDLQDLEHPLLKKIHDEAPGTWEHSRAAANLGEAAAAAVGADSLMVRVGAYVHDAGKSLSPDYFIENQNGKVNPHDGIDPDESAQFIFDHVVEGTDLLRRHHVPEAIAEFAYTHHGTSQLEYFWIKNMQAGNPKGLKEKNFRYPGMKPRTRETGILMLVDAVEAASRTVKEPSKREFEGLVQRIVFTKMTQGQLDKCGLSLSDLKTVTNVLVDSLVNMYHARIEYQWQREDGASQTTTTGSRSITQTGPQSTTSTGIRQITDTGPRTSTTGTGPHSVTDTGPRTSTTGTGPRSVTDTGPRTSTTGTGPHSVTDTGPRTSATGTGPHSVTDTGPQAPPRDTPSGANDIFTPAEDIDEPDTTPRAAPSVEPDTVVALTKPAATSPSPKAPEEEVIVRVARPADAPAPGEPSPEPPKSSLARPGTDPGLGSPYAPPRRPTNPLPTALAVNSRKAPDPPLGENSRGVPPANHRVKSHEASTFPQNPETQVGSTSGEEP